MEILGWLIFNKLDKNQRSKILNDKKTIDFLEQGYIFNPNSLQSIIEKGTEKLSGNSLDFLDSELGIRFRGLVEGFVQCPEFISNYLGSKAQLILSKIVIGKNKKNLSIPEEPK